MTIPDPRSRAIRKTLATPVQVKKIHDKQYHVDIQINLVQQNANYEGKALLDTGATGCLIHPEVVKQYGFKTEELEIKRKIYNADGTQIKGGISKSVTGTLKTGIGNTRQTFAVSDIGDDKIIIGLDWIRKANPIIDWQKAEMKRGSLRSSITYRGTANKANKNKQEKDWTWNKKRKRWYYAITKQWYTTEERKLIIIRNNQEREEEETSEEIIVKPKRKRRQSAPAVVQTKEVPLQGIQIRKYGKKLEENISTDQIRIILQAKEEQRKEELKERNPRTRTRKTQEIERNIPIGRKYIEPHIEYNAKYAYPDMSEGVTAGVKRDRSISDPRAPAMKRHQSESVLIEQPMSEDELMDPPDLQDESVWHPGDWQVARIKLTANNNKLAYMPKRTFSQQVSQEKAKREGRHALQSNDPRKLVPKILWKYLPIFSKEKAKRLPKSSKYDMKIEFQEGAELPKLKRVYKVPEGQKQSMKEFIMENLEKGFIRRPKEGSNAYSIASPTFMIGKKDGGERVVIDYRPPNKITKNDAYPMPTMEVLRYQKPGTKYYTTLDLRNGYNNVRIRKGDEWKAAFRTIYGVFEPTVMFFGMKNSPAHFQRYMDTIFEDVDEDKRKIYLDDILIAYGETLEEHISAVKEVLEVLAKNDLYCKPEKCYFFQEEVDYLGMKVSQHGIAMDPDKVKAIMDWPVCKTVKEIRQFLGFCGFYRQYIPNFSALSKPLTKLTQKNEKFIWGLEQEYSMKALKKLFDNGPILQHPNYKIPFILKTDASKYAIGAVLEQESQGQIRPISFFSRGMKDAETNYKIFDKEMLAVIEALEHWRHLLLGTQHPIDIITDHSALKYFGTKQKLSERQVRWMETLSEYNYTIRHQPGKEAVIPDALSRRPDYKRKIDNNMTMIPSKAIRTQLPVLITKTVRIEMQEKDTIEYQIKQEWQRDQLIDKEWPLYKPQKGYSLIRTSNCIYLKNGKEADILITIVPPNNDIRKRILEAYHDDEEAGHPGTLRTEELIRREYWWPKMKIDVKQYVKHCSKCQQNKPIRQNRTPPLQLTELAQRPWEIITYDLIGPLPPNDTYDGILTIVDRYSKYVELVPINMKWGSEQIINALQTHIFKRYGYPRVIITDRDPRFTSKFMQEVANAFDIDMRYSTAYHPETDGQTERVNQEAIIILRHYVSSLRLNWKDKLDSVQIALNNRLNQATQQSAFQVMLGYNPIFKDIGRNVKRHSSNWIQELNENRQRASRAMKDAQLIMKQSHDRKRGKLPSYQEGEKVWLETTNLNITGSRKLGPRRIGPFKILKKISDTAYKLKLPRKYLKKIHDVFNVALLHKANVRIGEEEPLPDIIAGEEEYEVETILDKKEKYGYLVKWKGYDEPTWEPIENLSNASELVSAYDAQHHTAKKRKRKSFK